MICLDYDLAAGVDSVAVAEFLREMSFPGSVRIPSEDPFGQQGLKRILPSAQVMAFGSFEIARKHRPALNAD